MTPSSNRLPCGTALALALLLAVAAAVVAHQQWFVRDDLVYLAQVRGGFPHVPWSWRNTFLPELPGLNWVYRPLSLETFFYLCHSVFGLNAMGYFAVSLAFHFASGALVYAIASRLGFHPAAALFSGLLSVALHPSLTEVFFLSIFTYISAKFWMLASILLAQQHWRRRAPLWALASVVALALGLLSNELSIVTPAVVGLLLVSESGLRPSKNQVWRIALMVGMGLLTCTGWLVLRYGVIETPPQPPGYGPALGPHTTWIMAKQLAAIFGSSTDGALLLLAWVGPPTVASMRNDVARTQIRWLGLIGLVLVGWLAVTLAPFALLRSPQIRFSIAAEVPASLLIGAGMSACWRLWGSSMTSVLTVAAALTVILAVPYSTLIEVGTTPRGDHTRAVVDFVASAEPPIPEATTLVVLYGGSDMASEQDARIFMRDCWNGVVLHAVYPERRLRLQLLAAGTPLKFPCFRCVFAELTPDMVLLPTTRPEPAGR